LALGSTRSTPSTASIVAMSSASSASAEAAPGPADMPEAAIWSGSYSAGPSPSACCSVVRVTVMTSSTPTEATVLST
jgi:hypothetical protein